jgi:hypothetical protein
VAQDDSFGDGVQIDGAVAARPAPHHFLAAGRANQGSNPEANFRGDPTKDWKPR